MRAVLRRRPLTAFFVLVFGINWTMSVVRQPPIPPGAAEPADVAGAVLSAVALRVALLSPAIAAVVMAWAVDGRAGLRDLLRRCTLWRVGWRWYVIVLTAFPLVSGAAIGVALIVTGAASPSGDAAGWSTWLALPLLVALGGPLHEELGWRGFALPRMLDRLGDLSASVVLGLLWAAWHWRPWELPELFATHGVVTVFVPNQIATVALAVVMTWVYRATDGSALLAGFGMHLSANLVLAIVFTGAVVTAPAAVTWGQAAGLTALAVAVVAAYGPTRFARRRGSPAVRPSPGARS